MLDPSQIVHWTLCHAGRPLTCVERVTPSGSECVVLYDGLPVATRLLAIGQDVSAWAAQIRQRWELQAIPSPTKLAPRHDSRPLFGKGC
jgi:hypothetical protein